MKRLLLIASCFCFVLSTLGISAGVNLTSLGLALWVLSILI